MTALNQFARAAIASINSSRAAPLLWTPPAGPGGQRTAPRASGARHVQMSAGTGKASRPGTLAKPAVTAAPGSRFAHFAGMTLSAPVAAPPKIAAPRPEDDAAAFVLASAAKARGQNAPVMAKAPIAAKPDMATPEGVAAFVVASAAKARGGRR